MNTKYIVIALLLLLGLFRARPVSRHTGAGGPEEQPSGLIVRLSHSGFGFPGAVIRCMAGPHIGIEFSQVPSTSGNLLNDAIANNYSDLADVHAGGKLSAMAEVERKRGRVLEENRSAFLVDLRGRVSMNYYRLWLLDRQIDVGERTLNTLKSLAEAMRMQVYD